MADLDLHAARYCARVTVSHYRMNGIELPPAIRDHAAWLEAGGTADGTEKGRGAEQLRHDNFIGATEAAAILGCTVRYVTRIATDLDGVQVSGVWIFREDVVRGYVAEKANRDNRIAG